MIWQTRIILNKCCKALCKAFSLDTNKRKKVKIPSGRWRMVVKINLIFKILENSASAIAPFYDDCFRHFIEKKI